MRIKMRALIVISVAILGVFITWSYFKLTTTSFAYRQVKATAPSSPNYLLPFPTHISETARPHETFNFPIQLGQVGPSQSLYSGAKQYPFYCMSVESKLGQPIIDNQQGYGVPIYDDLERQSNIIGYSKDCGVKSQLDYYVISDTQTVKKLSAENVINVDVNNNDHLMLLRVEQGTINRFIYTIVMPITPSEVNDRLAKSSWNQKLIYQFNGGSGIGYRQGKQTAARVIKRQLQQLLDGYAVISSSGNKTSYTYNMLLAEDTARRVKKQFTSLYGEPLYTIGVGGSGGGLAQYLIAQNSYGILDGLIPQYSYPDMITTATYALDCDLLNNYYTFRAEHKHNWQDWDRRQFIEGLNSKNDMPQRAGFLQPVNQLMAGFAPSLPDGNSECINGYFGLSSFINNPKQGFLRDYFHASVKESTHWSYWQGMAHILGKDQLEFGLSTWDNVGVQYGLQALKSGKITIDEFLDINQKIGSWKRQPDMAKEFLFTPFGKRFPIWLSLWGNQNITELEQDIAPRHSGSIAAMHAAYRSGQVFLGKVNLPIIDVRHYLEDELDMHHTSASFYSRLRMIQANGHANNQIIWVADKDYDPTKHVFDKMDQWLMALNQLEAKHFSSKKSFSSLVAASKPKDLSDTCFNENGKAIASGKSVWHDNWNNQSQGKCAQHFKIYSNSRVEAGASWHSDIFKCQTMSVAQAIEKNIYGEVNIKPYLSQLNAIFPDGVCDYSLQDAGRPIDI